MPDAKSRFDYNHLETSMIYKYLSALLKLYDTQFD